MSLIDAIKNYKPVNENENQALKWWTFQEALKASTEPWMVERVYKKLIDKTEVVEG